MSEGNPPKIIPQKPYAFAAVPKHPTSRAPIFHDGWDASRLVSGELRCQLTNLTPLLVGWERVEAAELTSEMRERLGQVSEDKPVLFPLRMPGPEGAVVIPGDSLKGLLRHELGILLGAPMERVAERHYSYRPNAMFPDDKEKRFLEPRLARVSETGRITAAGGSYPTPIAVEIYPFAEHKDQTYYPRIDKKGRTIDGGTAPPLKRYRGGMGGGELLPDNLYPEDEEKPRLARTKLELGKNLQARYRQDGGTPARIEEKVRAQYGQTLEHFFEEQRGHFSRRHPGVTNQKQIDAALNAVEGAAQKAFQIDDFIWVEWDEEEQQVVSFGWHYYYRWAYRDTVRRRGGPGGDPREELVPTEEERAQHGAEVNPGGLSREGAPKALTGVRRLLGYTGDNEGSKGIGEGHYSQLMGRLSINAALEDVRDGDEARFLPVTMLKELGQPRPSAVEHYLQQASTAANRKRDAAMLTTYGDAEGYDEPGELAGRKVYLHQRNFDKRGWEEDTQENRDNKRSTAAVDASREGRTFRFTIRFRDLEPTELAAVMLALCPDQLARRKDKAEDGKRYCSKLGYARPLGWGSVDITIRELHLLEELTGDRGELTLKLMQEPNLEGWYQRHAPMNGTSIEPPLIKEDQLKEWLKLHSRSNEMAGPYPTAKAPRRDEERPGRPSRAKAESERDSTPQTHLYHGELRAWHSRLRRYRRPGR